MPAPTIQYKCSKKYHGAGDVIIRHEWGIQIRKQINEWGMYNNAQEITVIGDKVKAIIFWIDGEFVIGWQVVHVIIPGK